MKPTSKHQWDLSEARAKELQRLISGCLIVCPKTISGIVNGVKYQLKVDGGKVVQFFPL